MHSSRAMSNPWRCHPDPAGLASRVVPAYTHTSAHACPSTSPPRAPRDAPQINRTRACGARPGQPASQQRPAWLCGWPARSWVCAMHPRVSAHSSARDSSCRGGSMCGLAPATHARTQALPDRPVLGSSGSGLLGGGSSGADGRVGAGRRRDVEALARRHGELQRQPAEPEVVQPAHVARHRVRLHRVASRRTAQHTRQADSQTDRQIESQSVREEAGRQAGRQEGREAGCVSWSVARHARHSPA